MELDTVVQLVTVLVAALAIVWHQQHNTNELRGDSNAAHHQLREGINENGQRLARIEGLPTVADESIDAGSK